MKAIQSAKRRVFFVGGIGSGKTYTGGLWVLVKACLVGSIGLVTAPVMDTLTNSTLPGLMHCWASCGIHEGQDYVVGTRPPIEWGIEAYTHRNGKVLTWRWGSYTIIDGSDNFNKHRGLELDYVYIDEYRDVKEQAYKVFDGRLRGKAVKQLQKSGVTAPYQILVTTTPPENPIMITQHAGDNTDIIYSTSYDNKHNLPDDYIESLKSNYDEITYRREVMGEMVNVCGTDAYYAFDAALNIVSMPFMANNDVYLCWDFNASLNKPMSTIAVQEMNGVFYAVKEWIHKDSNTYSQCELISGFLRDEKFSGNVIVTGDYSGNRRESNATRSDYAIIESYFRDYYAYKVRTRPTLAVKDRVASLNALFCNTVKERRLFVSQECKKLIEDLTKTRWKENGISLDDSDPERTHPTDALSYFAYNFFPIERKPISISVNG